MAKQEAPTDAQPALECFESEDDGFVNALRRVADSKWLAEFASGWKRDQRPWANEQKLAYLRGEPNCVGHQTVVKQLFKQAEEDGDHAVLAACAALFDRLVRHTRRTRYVYDWQSRTSWQEEYLAAEGRPLPYGNRQRTGINPFTGEKMVFAAQRAAPGAIYFSYRTRYYLQRRAWRYYRRLGQLSPERYVDAAALLLGEYRDADFDRGERILDSWTLLQMAFREHPALEFGRERVRLAKGGKLGNLGAAPRFRELWQTAEAFDRLLALMQDAPSRLVRVWAMQLIQQEHSQRMAALPAETLIRLLVAGDSDVRRFARELLKSSPGARGLPVATWLELLGRAPPDGLADVCEAMHANVDPEELTLEECVALAVREPATVSEMGFKWLQAKQVRSEDEHEQIANLADTRCAANAEAVAEYALRHVGSRDEYDRDHVSRFFDSLQPGVRRQAMAWLERDDCPGAKDAVLFCRVLETPFDEVRLGLISLLQRRNVPGEARQGLAAVWSAVLLGVHRGGRQKLAATRQLAAELVLDPSQVDELLPVLSAAVRSVRGPEARAGLAAVVASLATRPELGDAVARHLPELQLLPEDAPA